MNEGQQRPAAPGEGEASVGMSEAKMDDTHRAAEAPRREFGRLMREVRALIRACPDRESARIMFDQICGARAILAKRFGFTIQPRR
ncbi:MAG TPA: hypothetical protein VFD58_32100 [Blastocatellia bacterium]|nr:hypothetical protein [Blastocatellia bacterium]